MSVHKIGQTAVGLSKFWKNPLHLFIIKQILFFFKSYTCIRNFYVHFIFSNH